ncbi:MAG TPA: hypothetical protein VMJ75_12265 [Candidatus Acidoferrales bacterium]|nr:hypothetical protein [Candidatus Acidoferrales bacterium]
MKTELNRCGRGRYNVSIEAIATMTQAVITEAGFEQAGSGAGAR